MKRLNVLILLLMFLLITSCNKDEVDGVDKFVGIYSVSAIEYVTWGSSSSTLTNTGTLHITKISGNRVSTSGIFSTQGTVSGTSLYLEGFRVSDASGYISYSFSPAVISGDVMTLTLYGSGKLGENGQFYPYNITSNITAIRM